MNITKLTLLCSVTLLTGCVASTGRIHDIDSLVTENTNIVAKKGTYFESLVSDNEYEYVIRVNEPYFNASSADGLRPKSLMESSGHIVMAKSEVSESNIFKYLLERITEMGL